MDRNLTPGERGIVRVIRQRLYGPNDKDEAIKYLFSLYGGLITRQAAEKVWDHVFNNQ